MLRNMWKQGVLLLSVFLISMRNSSLNNNLNCQICNGVSNFPVWFSQDKLRIGSGKFMGRYVNGTGCVYGMNHERGKVRVGQGAFTGRFKMGLIANGISCD